MGDSVSQSQPQLLAALPVVQTDGTMSQAFRTHLQRLSHSVVIVGTGNPEGVLEAPQYSLYIDETTPTVPVQYRKMLTDIAGNSKQGWVVV